jgi:hypothetical protein
VACGPFNVCGAQWPLDFACAQRPLGFACTRAPRHALACAPSPLASSRVPLSKVQRAAASLLNQGGEGGRAPACSLALPRRVGSLSACCVDPFAPPLVPQRVTHCACGAWTRLSWWRATRAGCRRPRRRCGAAGAGRGLRWSGQGFAPGACLGGEGPSPAMREGCPARVRPQRAARRGVGLGREAGAGPHRVRAARLAFRIGVQGP